MNLLKVENLKLCARAAVLVEDVSFAVAPGEILAIVGESGSGKTLSALSVLGLLPPGITRGAGEITLDGIDVAHAKPAKLRELRGGVAGMIFQEPLSSLNPLMRVGEQVGEAMLLHGGLSRAGRRQRVLKLLAEVGLTDLDRIAGAYPHLLSGGQRQRMMIAMALANNPKLLIADEPTAALDAVLQRQILDLIAAERDARGLGVLLITHDLALVRRYAGRVLVMARGRMVETGSVAEIFGAPRQSETKKLLGAKNFAPPPPVTGAPKEILRGAALTLKFPVLRGRLRRKTGEVTAVDDVCFSLRAGETLGVVGESGSGKSTLALMLLRLVKFSGTVFLDGQNLGALNGKQLRAIRRHIQIVFQDPYGSLPPRMNIGDIIGEGLRIHAPHLGEKERVARVHAALREVALPGDILARYPHEFSGGQRQRIAIARALILQPKLLVLDEPTSALDVTVQAEIVRLLLDLQRRHGMAYIFISHDLVLVRALAHRVLVLKAGRAVEYGDAAEILERPKADYANGVVG